MNSIGGYAFKNCTALKTVNYTGSEEDWNNIEKGKDIFTYYHLASYSDRPIDCTFHYNYVEPQPGQPEEPQPSQPEGSGSSAAICSWCGRQHEGFFQDIICFFHDILAAIFGARY